MFSHALIEAAGALAVRGSLRGPRPWIRRTALAPRRDAVAA